MSILPERIQVYCKSKNVSIRQFEMVIEASNGVISNAIKNKTDIRASWISIILEQFPDINPEWLLTGKGEMLRTDEQNETGDFLQAFSSKMRQELDEIKKRLDGLEGK